MYRRESCRYDGVLSTVLKVEGCFNGKGGEDDDGGGAQGIK